MHADQNTAPQNDAQLLSFLEQRLGAGPAQAVMEEILKTDTKRTLPEGSARNFLPRGRPYKTAANDQ